MKQAKRALSMLLLLAMALSLLSAGAWAAGTETEAAESASSPWSAALELEQESVVAGASFSVQVVLKGTAGEKAPAAAQVALEFSGGNCSKVTPNSSISVIVADYEDGKCLVNYCGYSGSFDDSGELLLATYTFTAGETVGESVTVKITEAAATAKSDVVSGTLASRECISVADGEGEITEFIAAPTTIEIGTEAELRQFAENVNSGVSYAGKLVILTDDITLTGAWTPIGISYYTSPFTGTFDGAEHTIRGLSISLTPEEILAQHKADSNATNYGLFGCVKDAVIQNLTVDGAFAVTEQFQYGTSTSDAEYYMGGICGQAYDSSIRNCTSLVNFTCEEGITGGIVGSASGTIANCANYGDLFVDFYISNGDVGGIAGEASGTITQCANYGNIETDVGGWTTVITGGSGVTEREVDYIYEAAKGKMGGLAGSAGHGMTITDSCNKGTLTGKTLSMGGLIGSFYGVDAGDMAVTNCYNTGAITFTAQSDRHRYAYAGGLIGGSHGNTTFHVTLTNCYNTGTVSKLYTVGPVSGKTVNCTVTDITAQRSTLVNTYGPSDSESITAAQMGSAYKADVNNINGGYPLLAWEDDTVSDTTYAVTFEVSPANAAVTVYRDSAMTQAVGTGTSFQLKQGTYFYKVQSGASGYETATGSFTVVIKPVTVSVTLKQAAVVTFRVTPANADFTLEDASGNEQAPIERTDGGVYEYQLYVGAVYTYNASAKDYNSVTREYLVTGDAAVTVEMTQRAKATDTIWGDGNGQDEAHPHTIEQGGSYYIGEGATGVITINTSDEVTLVGAGTGASSMYTNLYIDCTEQATGLTLQDVYIYNTTGSANMIDFANGQSNTLTFAGTSILDMDTGATGYAMIHVPDGTTLTVTGGTAYFYKREQGAGIGGNGGAKGSDGQDPETNGTIKISQATLFMKNSKQGALIGAGADAGTQTPGSITITNSELYLIANSRGGAIGGSAGSGGASDGSNVTVSNSTVTINVDYTGAAIGGGGYAGGNDADGGTLNVSNSSIRTYIDTNAVSSWGVSSAGVNGNKAITADIYTGGKPAYLLIFDTSMLSGNAGSFNVSADGKTVYSGGLHRYSYINEDTSKYGQIDITYTMDNWVSLDDPNLYLYLTGEDHTLTVNNETFQFVWNADSKSFTLAEESALYTTERKGTSATATFDSAVLAAYLKNVKSGDVITVDITSDVGGTTVTDAVTMLTTADAAAIAGAGVSLKTVSPVGEITLSAEALKNLAAQSGSQIAIGASSESDGIHIDVAVDGKSMTQVSGGVTVTLPVTNRTASTILVLVGSDGTETVLEDAVFTAASVTVTVDGSCVLKVTEKSKKVLSTTEITRGVATTTIDSEALTELLNNIGKDTQLVITADNPNGKYVYRAVTVLTHDDAAAIANAGISLNISSALADIVLPNASLKDLARRSGDTITVSAEELKDGIAIEVAVNGKAVGQLNGGLWITLPVDAVTRNTALMLVDADGDETELEDADFGRYSVTVWVEGSCTLELVEKPVTVDTTTVVKDGVTITTVDSEALAEELKDAGAGTQLVITVEIPEDEIPLGGIAETETVLTRAEVRAVGETEAALKISTPFADVVFSSAALNDLAGDPSLAEDDEVSLTVSEQAAGTVITVAVAGKTVSQVEGGLLVTLPAETTAGSVLVLVGDDGSQTVIKKSALGTDTVTAQVSGSCTVKVIDNSRTFTDVLESDWYADSVAFAAAHELFNGVSDTEFAPTGTMTRAMLVTVLHRLEDTPAAAAENSFDDVDAGTWYTDAVIWADANGIVQGYGNGSFGSTDSVTREQIATILYRYAQYLGLDVSAGGSLGRFSDGETTSDWALEAMQWAVSSGIITGKDTGADSLALDPGGVATRAEVATMLQRLVSLIVQ